MTPVEVKAATRGLLAALKLRCEGTHDHSQRVARASQLIAQQLRLTDQIRTAVYYGALLHDTGKIGTREAILKKAGAHTPIEQMHMREHPLIGAEALSDLYFPAP